MRHRDEAPLPLLALRTEPTEPGAEARGPGPIQEPGPPG
jgi:hypothetical protein